MVFMQAMAAMRLPLLPDVTALTPQALAGLMPGPGGRPSLAHGRAVWRWLRGTPSPDAWPARLPEAGRAALARLKEQARLPEIEVCERMQSRDGTVKWRLSCRGAPVETVLIPHAGRSTVCVSSQSGCTRSCGFCATARMPFSGQLTAGEMVGQVLLARASAPDDAPVKSVVFMGMGEPLDNLPQVLAAIEALEHGLSIGPAHVTVSTSGVLPAMRELASRSRACIALSLHATTDAQRALLMPGTARWPLAQLLAFMREVTRESGRHFFIEYVLLRGVNDSDEDARRLVASMSGIRARVNLIPFNAIGDGDFARPDEERVRAFHDVVVSRGVLCLTRQPRGEDASAACGQLVVQPTRAG
jgi:23S rRNA (adenine2503-C2)-methyltransferase